MDNTTPDQYWATITYDENGSISPDSTRHCGDHVLELCDNYYTWLRANGFMTRWARLYAANYANTFTSGSTVDAGENGEYLICYVNHFNSLLEHVQNLAITERPAWEPQATNNDSQTQKQTLIARCVLDYYMRDKRIERHLRDATRNALLFGEGFVTTEWDRDSGDAIAADVETGEQRRPGDLLVRAHEPVDVIRDPALKKFHDRNWLVVRSYENKYDLAEKYPEYRSEIINQKYSISEKNHYLNNTRKLQFTETDLITVYKFYHGKTGAVPEGRQQLILEDGTIITDSILQYEKIPVHRLTPEEQIGLPMGKSVATDLLPIQEMIDAHYSTILSINRNFGVPKILLPTGSNIQADTMGAGFDILEYNSANGEPKVMQMPQPTAAIGQTLQQMVAEAQTISGVNAVTRGTPPPSLQSGSALALVQSMAIQFNAPLQQSYIQLLEDVGTAIISILKDYADVERVIQITGQKNKNIVQTSFTRDDLKNIHRVTVQAGNALSKTVSGRLTIAETLLKNKVITNAQEYLMVLETGILDPMTQGETLTLLNLSSENEMLMDGKQVPVLFTDDHVLHIREHTAFASDPAVRADPERFAVIAGHIGEHMKYLSDPNYQQYLQLMGLPSFAQAMPGGGAPQGGGQGTPPNGAVTQPNGATPQGSAAIQEKAAGIQPPQSPLNKLNNQRPPLATGV